MPQFDCVDRSKTLRAQASKICASGAASPSKLQVQAAKTAFQFTRGSFEATAGEGDKKVIPQTIRQELRETMLAYARQKRLRLSESLSPPVRGEQQPDPLTPGKNGASAQASTAASIPRL